MKRITKNVLVIGVIGILIVIFAFMTNRISKPTSRPHVELTKSGNSLSKEEEILRKKLKESLWYYYDSDELEYHISDLDEDGQKEIFVAYVRGPLGWEFKKGYKDPIFRQLSYFAVFSITDGNEGYEMLGSLQFEDGLNQYFFDDIPKVQELRDIDGDAQKEIFLTFTYFAKTSCPGEAILDLNTSERRLKWVERPKCITKMLK